MTMLMMTMTTTMTMMIYSDDDDEWTQVSSNQLQSTDTAVTDPTIHSNTQEEVMAASDDAVKPSDDSQTPSADASCIPTLASSSADSTDAPNSQLVHDPTPAPSDITEVSADVTLSHCVESHSMVTPSTSADHDSVVSSQSSDQTKSDGLVIVSVTPERTSPSDENSSNAKGWLSASLAELLHITPSMAVVLKLYTVI